MCIALVSTQHPRYPFILLNNRDEFLHRPTLRASWWDTPDTSHIFSGRDLARPEKGTWLGITRQGRLAVLTNFRESSEAAAYSTRSRGAMVNAFLTASPESTKSTKDWAHHLLNADGDEGIKSVGGFSVICGTIHPKKGTAAEGEEGKVATLEPLAVISNRTPSKEDAQWCCSNPGEVHALSNALFEDKDPWPKVKLGKSLLKHTVEKCLEEDATEEELIEKLFAVLSHDTLPVTKGKETYDTDLESLRHSVFIPAFVAHEEGTDGDHDDDDVEEDHADPTVDEINHMTSDDTSFMCDHVPSHEVPTVPANGTPITNGQNNKSSQRPILILSKGEPTTNGTGTPPALEHICASPTSPSFAAPQGVEFSSPRVYGTQKQTVILVDREGRVKFVERTLYDEQARWVGGVDNRDGRDTVCEFTIEGWRD